MRISDVTVEVRDKALARKGLILPQDLVLNVNELHNNVGDWTLELPIDHPMSPHLGMPGAGLIVTGPEDVLFSGPVITPSFKASEDDPIGTLTFGGVTDSILLADRLAYPEPSNVDPTAQTVAFDVRSGSAEALIHAYVNANLGPSAPASRRVANLVMGTNLHRGATTKKSARFDNVGRLCADLALPADLGFRIVQRGDHLVFETFAIADRTLDIRLDIFNGTISSEESTIVAPTVTRVIVAGPGDGTNRDFYSGTSATATAAEAAWGRRIERFADASGSADATEYQQKSDEVLADGGFTGVAVRLTPADDATMRFGFDWNMGDRIAVVSNGTELAATVSGYILAADSDGLRLGVTIGDVSTFNRSAAQLKRLQSLAQRVDVIERSR